MLKREAEAMPTGGAEFRNGVVELPEAPAEATNAAMPSHNKFAHMGFPVGETAEVPPHATTSRNILAHIGFPVASPVSKSQSSSTARHRGGHRHGQHHHDGVH